MILTRSDTEAVDRAVAPFDRPVKSLVNSKSTPGGVFYLNLTNLTYNLLGGVRARGYITVSLSSLPVPLPQENRANRSNSRTPLRRPVVFSLPRAVKRGSKTGQLSVKRPRAGSLREVSA